MLRNDDPEGQVLLRQNLAVLVPALRAVGVRRVEVTYAGARGRCSRSGITVLPVDAMPRLRETLVEFQRKAADGGQMPVGSFTDTLPLSEALLSFTLHWASLAFGYWQQLDGGQGVMRIVVDDGLLTLDHDEILVERHHATLQA
jgi:hypothetical protein